MIRQKRTELKYIHKFSSLQTFLSFYLLNTRAGHIYNTISLIFY